MFPLDLHFKLCEATHDLVVEAPRREAEIVEAIQAFTEALALVEARPVHAEAFRPFAHHLQRARFGNAYQEQIRALVERATPYTISEA